MNAYTFSGVFYCTTHHGVANEDSDVCDFYDDGSNGDCPLNCVFHPLYYDPQETDRTEGER